MPLTILETLPLEAGHRFIKVYHQLNPASSVPMRP